MAISDDRAESGAPASQGWSIAIGILLILGGIVALIAPGVAAISASIFLGWLLLLLGVAGVVMGLRTRHGRGHASDVIFGILSIIAGLVIIFDPLGGTLSVALGVAIWLIVRGVVGLVYAFRHPHERTWLIFGAVIDLILGILLWASWPFPAVQMLGLAVGISFLMAGVVTLTAGSRTQRRFSTPR